MSTHPLVNYLNRMSEIRSSGSNVAETSFYPALEQLLNEAGKGLAPRVSCIMNLKDVGAGLPDGGLFTADQVKRRPAKEQIIAQLPARGAIEVKAPKAALAELAASKQVEKYLNRYNQVLATNYRQFVVVMREGNKTKLGESFSLADSESAFWEKARHTQTTKHELGDSLLEYLQRVMLQSVPLANPQDVAWFLASYAREAKRRVEATSHLEGLQALRQALEEALGMKFQGKEGDHFFQATLVQTLFYGLFSAWALWKRSHTGRFDWHSAQWFLNVPMIGTLFQQISQRDKLKPLHLEEVLDWTGDLLNRVVWDEFDRKFESEHAVQYFYEPFLKAYDPELRKELGVWYTPPEIVKYQVARVDRVLREELDVEDGLADPQVIVLDPCCGTGAYLVEVLNSIYNTLKEKGDDAGLAHRLKEAASKRIFGFEILPAPYVISHLQLGLLLHNLGAPWDDKKQERARVYLTNALTGWEPPKDEGKKKFVQQEVYSELFAETKAARRVKQEERIIVILGNPPYNGFAGVAVDEERDLSDAYRKAKTAPAPQGQGLNDLYVRFFRMAERKIQQSGMGIVCFISNYAWLDGLSHTGMRENYVYTFDNVWIDCLNGDKYKTGKLTPEGDSDPSVFSTPQNREGIQVGTAIATLLKRKGTTAVSRRRGSASILYRDLWGKEKLHELEQQATAQSNIVYGKLSPKASNGYPLVPFNEALGYSKWPLLSDIFPASFPGIKTSRDQLLVDIDKEALEKRMQAYFDPGISYAQMGRISPTAVSDTSGFSATDTRNRLQLKGFDRKRIKRYLYRPFDLRWLYYEDETKLIDRKRGDYIPHVAENNLWIPAVQHNRKVFDPPAVTHHYCSGHIIERGANLFPLQLCSIKTGDLFASERSTREQSFVSNLSKAAVDYVSRVVSPDNSEALFSHVIATLYAPAFCKSNREALGHNWPRIPLPNSKQLLENSADLGSRIAALLDTEKPVSGITSGKIRPELKIVASIVKVGGGSLRPASGDTDLTAGWGHGGKDGVTMPGKGKIVERPYSDTEMKAIVTGATALGLTLDQILASLGKTTCDIYLNDRAFWQNIPINVWKFYIGGYQVIKKWLSYRDKSLLNRGLTMQEVDYVSEMARRLTAIVLLQPLLDANYHAVKENTYPWPQP